MLSLIVGMGIGGLYKTVTANINNIDVVTVDINPAMAADYVSVDRALEVHKKFDVAHICTPNFTHYALAEKLAAHVDIIFIEKPGVDNSKLWMKLKQRHPKTKFVMVKNNQWRTNIDAMQRYYANCKKIKLHWINKNRVPKPGSWFTNRDLAFGGVSRDLIPHLLSLLIAVEPNYQDIIWAKLHSYQKWRLQDLTDSDYGDVQNNGVYNVDDCAELLGRIADKTIEIVADWRSNNETDIAVYFDDKRIELGLCPESAYQKMIENCIWNKDNHYFWQNQFTQDFWIHSIIDKL